MRTDTQVAAAAVDKDVVALEVAVDDGRLMPVQVQQPAKDLLAPALDDLPSDHLEGRQASISIQCSCARWNVKTRAYRQWMPRATQDNTVIYCLYIYMGELDTDSQPTCTFLMKSFRDPELRISVINTTSSCKYRKSPSRDMLRQILRL